MVRGSWGLKVEDWGWGVGGWGLGETLAWGLMIVLGCPGHAKNLRVLIAVSNMPTPYLNNFQVASFSEGS